MQAATEPGPTLQQVSLLPSHVDSASMKWEPISVKCARVFEAFVVPKPVILES
jgi:hypothetical protein